MRSLRQQMRFETQMKPHSCACGTNNACTFYITRQLLLLVSYAIAAADYSNRLAQQEL
jgi:hypothetical protein